MWPGDTTRLGDYPFRVDQTSMAGPNWTPRLTARHSDSSNIPNPPSSCSIVNHPSRGVRLGTMVPVLRSPLTQINVIKSEFLAMVIFLFSGVVCILFSLIVLSTIGFANLNYKYRPKCMVSNELKLFENLFWGSIPHTPHKVFQISRDSLSAYISTC